MNNLNEAFESYTDLEKDNNRIEKELSKQYQALKEISDCLDTSTLRIVNRQENLKDDCKKARRYFKVMMPISMAIIFAVNITSCLAVGVPLGTTIFDLFLSSAIYFGLSYPNIKRDIGYLREYESNEVILSGENHEAVARLRDLRELAKSLGAQQRQNKEQMEMIGKEIIRLLSEGMEEEYQRQGIDDTVDISEAKIIANTNNRLELAIRRGDKNNG